MKSYNHIFESFISDENIKLAIKNASKGKNKRPTVKRNLEDPKLIEKIKYYAMHYKNSNHKPKTIYDGITKKKREIIVPKFHELIIQHMLMNVLSPIFMKGMYAHSYGSIPGRGAHKGKNRILKWINKKDRDMKYCLKMDIKKYFDSIPHNILINKFRKIIHDAKILVIIEEIINVNDHGIPLGFYSSQWIANWYLQGLDHYIKEELHAKYYIRYMDDMVIFSGNKKELHKMRKEIERYLNTLGLKMKENWQVFRFHYVNKKGLEFGRFLDFMGFRFYRNRITMRRSIMLRAARKAKKIGKKYKPTIYEIRQFLSYLGWISNTDSYRFFKTYIQPHVNIRKLKKRMSVYDKRNNIQKIA